MNTKIINYIVKLIRKTRINKRLFASFLIISILPITVMFLVVNKISIGMIEDNIVSTNKLASKLISQSISNYISKFDSITNEIIFNTNIVRDMKNYKSLSIKERNKFNDEISDIIRSRTSYISDIADFTIMNIDLNVVYNEGFSYIRHEVKLNEIAKSIEDNNSITYTSIRNGNSNYIAITRPIKTSAKTYGYLFLALKEKVILEIIDDYNLNLNGFGLILDDDKKIIASNSLNFNNIDGSLEGYSEYEEKINLENLNTIKTIDKFTSIEKINNKKYIVSRKPISYTPWTLYGIIPYDYIYSSCNDMYKTYALISVVIIAASIMLAMIIYISIINPLNKILIAMHNMDENTIGDEIVVTGSDEISYIMEKYNITTKKARELISTIKIREKEKREVTFRMLQAQINPHFLFNTLGSLRYIAIMNNDNVVSQGLEALAKLLRNIILKKDDFITIDEEIENVKNYITIQKLRYGDTFNVNYEIEEGVSNLKILKFIIQPIVENCILHGFEENDKENQLLIRIYTDDEFLNFEISDNGIGINEAKLNQGKFNIDKFAGIGIKNIQERLNLYYDKKCLFEIRSNENSGTISKIKILKTTGGVLNEGVNS